MKLILLFITASLFSAGLWAQQLQTIRGHVTDKESKTPLPGANVILPDTEPLAGTTALNLWMNGETI